MFKNVIVKKPAPSFVTGLTTSDLGKPDFEKALIQHRNYVEALKACGVAVTELEADDRYPDSVFVEDAAVLTPEFAVITNPGADTRNREIEAIEEALKPFYEKFHYITQPGTLDGGDVLQAGNQFYIGISERTNGEGARQLKEILESEGYEAEILPLERFFHLKTGIAYLGDNKLAVAGEFIEHPAFGQYEKIVIGPEDEYSANCIHVNDFVIIPSGYPETKRQLEQAGRKTIEVDMTEFRKQDGGLSCLSLRF
ncbi:dimethylarginine dimethylaminohydrolase family protein [Indiicoccus explosivorum]|uniref:dimethylarginine dimethylaminohydrolase family protein n=1 Tax=Indiicoccus explosivorum TaxID=1917864 RepID=UPI000B43B0D6|nr:arginine deiminase family protein [Indiicoccus explosivorum]